MLLLTASVSCGAERCQESREIPVETAAERTRPLSLGPLVGRTTSDAALLWLRTGGPREARIVFGETPDFVAARSSGAFRTRPDEDFTARVALDRLRPATKYYYRVDVDGVAAGPDPPASFVTAPEFGSQKDFSVAFGSCVGSEPQPVFSAIAAASPDLMLMLGDDHYGDSTKLEVQRFFYRANRRAPEFAALIARTPTLAIWDDHDFGQNDADGHLAGKDDSLRAFEEYWANGTGGLPGVKGVFNRFSWGDVDFFMLDVRYWRAIQARDSMLGRAQYDWLVSGLRSSRAVFKVVASGSPWNDQRSGDSWAAYAVERDAFFDAVMAARVPGLVLISGDRHRAEVWKLRNRSTTSYALFEYEASPLAEDNLPCKGVFAERLFCDDHGRFFGLLKFHPGGDRPSLEYEVRGDDGRLRFRHEQSLADLSPP